MEYFEYVDYFNSALKTINQTEITSVIETILDAYRANRNIFLIGNGGSASNASHFAQDLSKGTIRSNSETKRIKALSLADNVSLITAVSNDDGYDSIFSQQLITFAKQEDILIAISGSGNSPNILRAVIWANENNLNTISVTGYDGGKLKSISRTNLHVPLNDMCTVESLHSFLFHYIVIELKNRINS
jgi:D-sedoheptulose 7-phosphate isomerase